MAPEPLFIDSGGFYALVSAESAAHAEAVAIMEESRRVRRRAVTTDYVLDETATVLQARGLTKQVKEFLWLTRDVAGVEHRMDDARPLRCGAGIYVEVGTGSVSPRIRVFSSLRRKSDRKFPRQPMAVWIVDDQASRRRFRQTLKNSNQNKTLKNTKTCDILIRVGCRDLFIDKLRTSRRGASIVCSRDRRRGVGGGAPRPVAIRARPRMWPAMPFPSPGLQPTAASKRRLHARRPKRKNTMPAARTRHKATSQDSSC